LIYICKNSLFYGNPRFYKADDYNKRSNKTYGQLYKETLDKKSAYEAAGYKVISIWESDWKNLKNKINKIIDK
jgi:hypothetical protein